MNAITPYKPEQDVQAFFDSMGLVPSWKWRQANGQWITPCYMKTSHLFNTLKMIWNNFLPPSFRVGSVRLYSFNPLLYSKPYLAGAIVQIYKELSRRDDLSAGEKLLLDQMASKFRVNPKQIGESHGNT